MLSALDSRYANRLEPIADVVGEESFVYFMSIWSQAYAECTNPGIYIPIYTNKKDLYRRVSKKEVATKHQMVALLQVLQEDYPDVTFHYGLTSEDIMHQARWTQIAILNSRLNVVMKDIESAIKTLEFDISTPILAHTHGQPATPVELGPYLRAKIRRLSLISPEFRLGGSNGQLSILKQIYPGMKLDELALAWAKRISELIPELDRIQVITPTAKVGLLQHGPSNEATIMSMISTVLKYRALARALWDHCQRGVLVLMSGNEQAGSSAMPHKVNPVNYELSEGCFSNAYHILLNGLEANSDSRGLRDLSNSVVNRQLVEAWVWAYLGLKSLLRGMETSVYSQDAVVRELKANPECLTEYLRYYILENERGTDPYWELKKNPPKDWDVTMKRMENWKLFTK